MDDTKDVGQLGGPGSDVDPGMNVSSAPSLIDLLKAEDAKASRANANLQERLDDVAQRADESLGGPDDTTETSDQGD